MIKRLLKILPAMLLLMVFGSCRDEITLDTGLRQGDELPVEFEFILPENDCQTRSMENPRKEFENGDVIHVEATFEMREGGTYTSYTALEYDGDKKRWGTLLDATNPNKTPVMTWPNNATKGTFKAYYIHGSNAMLTPGASVPSEPASLSEMTGTTGMYGSPDTDPLQSINNPAENYGHAVRIKFEHACAYLIIDELPKGIADTFLFTQKNEEGESFKTAYQLTRTGNSLQLEFLRIPVSNGEYYVSGEAKKQTYEEEGEEKAYVGFFLAPGDYNSFSIGYPGLGGKFEPYLSYTKSETTGEDGVNENNTLEANGIYHFNVAKSQGIIKESDANGENWDEDGDYYIIVDPERFLYAISFTEDYYEKGVQILEATVNGGTRLLHNIDMQFSKYTYFEPDEKYSATWDPRLGRSKVFDGDFHYIKNIGSPFLHRNEGTIKNVGIENVKMDVIGYHDEDNMLDQSGQGALVALNSGTIQNVHFRKGLDITVNVNAEDDQNVLSIGCIVGYNTGTISEIYLQDTFTLHVQNYTGGEGSKEPVIPTLNIGGIVGLNTKNVSSVSPLSGTPLINIYNSCNGSLGEYYVGGFIGNNDGGTVEDIMLPDININTRNSLGIISCIGGIAGQMSEKSALLRNCVVSGSTWTGESTIPSGSTLSSQSYLGGMVGKFDPSSSIMSCTAVVGLLSPIPLNDGVLYGMGGVFGCISKTREFDVHGTIEIIISNGLMLDDTRDNMKNGDFAGIVPVGFTWEANGDWEGYSAAEKNIMVKENNHDENGERIYIGAEMDMD
ncbi:MAG: fimbrillin family protein [Muribaculaceae bacterium]|nr:fimbrillin family protein [Muribaculaceae bacterium]